MLLDVVTTPADAVWSEEVKLSSGKDFSLSIYGTFVGTVTVQRKFNDIDGWQTVATYTEPIEKDGTAAVTCLMRIGVAAVTDYTSGAIHGRLYS